jgi:hypothetical protein
MHMRTTGKQILFFLTLIISLSAAFTPLADWILVSSPEATMLFPEKPAVDSQSVASAIGELKIRTYMYEVADTTKDENLLYGYFVTAYPDSLINSDKKDGLDRYFKGSLDGTVNSLHGKVLSETKVEKDGFPGRIARISINDGLVIVVFANYLVHNKAIILQVMALANKDGNKSQDKFLQSLVLK